MAPRPSGRSSPHWFRLAFNVLSLCRLRRNDYFRTLALRSAFCPGWRRWPPAISVLLSENQIPMERASTASLAIQRGSPAPGLEPLRPRSGKRALSWSGTQTQLVTPACRAPGPCSTPPCRRCLRGGGYIAFRTCALTRVLLDAQRPIGGCRPWRFAMDFDECQSALGSFSLG